MKIEYFRSTKTAEWFFRFRARNGKIVAQSEGYGRKRSAVNAARSIKRSAASAKEVEGAVS